MKKLFEKTFFGGGISLFGFGIASLFLMGISAQYIASVFYEGSIFNWLRDGIATRSVSSEGIYFWGILYEKLNVLFHCPFCLSGQVGLWFFGVPTTILMYWIFRDPIQYITGRRFGFMKKATITLVFAFLWGMGVASISFGWWGIVDYQPRQLRLQAEFQQEKLRLYAISLERASGQNASALAELDPKRVHIQENDFLQVCVNVQEECRNSCSCQYGECVRNSVRSECRALAERYGLDDVQAEKLVNAFFEVREEYPAILRAGDRDRFIAKAWKSLLAML
jgi:hypothetical protein